jgi:hypothetical protein
MLFRVFDDLFPTFPSQPDPNTARTSAPILDHSLVLALASPFANSQALSPDLQVAALAVLQASHQAFHSNPEAYSQKAKGGLSWVSPNLTDAQSTAVNSFLTLLRSQYLSKK